MGGFCQSVTVTASERVDAIDFPEVVTFIPADKLFVAGIIAGCQYHAMSCAEFAMFSTQHRTDTDNRTVVQEQLLHVSCTFASQINRPPIRCNAICNAAI